MLAGRRVFGVITLIRPALSKIQTVSFVNQANMPAHVVLEPEGTTEAEANQHELLKQLLPFTFAISGFRGKPFTERGLIVHYKPQVCLNKQVEGQDGASTATSDGRVCHQAGPVNPHSWQQQPQVP